MFQERDLYAGVGFSKRTEIEDEISREVGHDEGSIIDGNGQLT